MNAEIPNEVIHSLNNTIVSGTPSRAVELLNQRVNELTQVSCTDQAMSADLRFEFSEYSRMDLGEIKAKEREMVRKGIDRLEMQIKQYISVYVSKDQVDIV